MDSNADDSNGKEKDKSKAAKQLHSVQKAFGSIGRETHEEVTILLYCSLFIKTFIWQNVTIIVTL